MGDACGTWIGEDTVTYQSKPGLKMRHRPTITYHEIMKYKMSFLDKNDIRTSIRNSIGDLVDENSDIEIDFRF